MLILNFPSSPPVEVIPATPAATLGTVYVGGEVATPGFYTWQPGMTLEDAIRMAGGPTGEAQPGTARLTLPGKDGSPPGPPKVNINTAEAWLLQALKGIGPKLSEAIVTYREEHGPFRRVDDLELVPGIGPGTVDKIRPFITVGE